MSNKKNNKPEKTNKNSKTLLIIISVVAVIAVLVAVYFLFFHTAVRYSIAVNQIEDGNFKDGFDTLIEIAEDNEDYKDTNELLYTRAIELIETGDIENKKAAYKMLEQIYGYKHTDSIAYYLWAEDIYDHEDENTYEQAEQFINMIPEDYDGPFAQEIAQYRKDIKADMAALNEKKAAAAMDEDEIFIQDVTIPQ